MLFDQCNQGGCFAAEGSFLSYGGLRAELEEKIPLGWQIESWVFGGAGRGVQMVNGARVARR